MSMGKTMTQMDVASSPFLFILGSVGASLPPTQLIRKELDPGTTGVAESTEPCPQISQICVEVTDEGQISR